MTLFEAAFTTLAAITAIGMCLYIYKTLKTDYLSHEL